MLALFYKMKMSKHQAPLLPKYYSDVDETLNLSPNPNVDMQIKCRVCLQKGSLSIFNRKNTEEIVEALQIIANINLDEEDEYPKSLCQVCYEFLLRVIAFRKIALKSEKILQQPVKEETKTAFESDHQDNSDGSNYDPKESPLRWSEPDNIGSQIKSVKKEKVKYNSKVTCHICHKVMNRSYYKEHITMHDPDHKKYVCDVCGKSFRLRCAYHNHSLRHRTDFPYKCQFCPYRGRYAELLKTHMRTHTGDYRYMCTECPARFLFKSNLNSHMLKHKEPPFKCDACKRAFHTKLMLQRHFEADHLGIKNHVCNMCGKAFGYRNAMMKHQRHVHKREKLLFGRMPSYLQAEGHNSNLNM